MANFGGKVHTKAMVRNSGRVILVNFIIFMFSFVFGLKNTTFTFHSGKGVHTCQQVSCICVEYGILWFISLLQIMKSLNWCPCYSVQISESSGFWLF